MDHDDFLSRPLQGSPYGYSGTRLERLLATEYTLVAIAADQSGSVSPFRQGIEDCIAEIVRACAGASRADNLMLRLTTFDGEVHEFHGFKPIPACDPAGYRGAVASGGVTALYDAAHNALGSVLDYGRTLAGHGFAVNGLVFVITDGLDCDSALGPEAVRALAEQAITNEQVRDLRSVLVGVNVGGDGVGPALMALSSKAGFDAYVEIDKADAAGLARLARLTTKSISLASTVLASGGSLTF